VANEGASTRTGWACGTRKLTMWWWQERFLRAGVAGRLDCCGKTRRWHPAGAGRGPRANGCLDARFDWTVIGQCMARHRHRKSSASSTVRPSCPLASSFMPCSTTIPAHEHARCELGSPTPAPFYFTPVSCSHLLVDLRGRDQPLPRRAQPQTQILSLDRCSQSHHREGEIEDSKPLACASQE
jgi:hypothetical protein